MPSFSYKLLVLFIFFIFLSAPLSCMALENEDEQVRDKKGVMDSDKPWRKKKDEKKKKKKKSVSEAKKFKLMARDLLGRPHWSDRFLNLLDAETPKIAIHPFKEVDLPITLSEAQIYVNGFTKALIREADGRYAVVGRKELGAVVSDINEMGTRSESINPLGDLIDRARSDLLAVGTLTLKGEKVILAYKLVETETGRIVSAAQKKFKRKAPEQVKIAGGLSLVGAAQKASSNLMRDLSSVRKIMVQGLRYQTSGIHTSFGRYFMELLSDGFRKQAASGPRNINSLDISDFIIEEELFRGLQLSKGGIEQAVLKEKGKDYILKGTYWVFDQIVEIRLTLENNKGQSVSWRGRIVRSEIPESFELIPPPAPIDEADQGTLGPIDLYLSSNKGNNPLFKLGEKMNLAVRTGRDAYLSCYYLQANGVIFRIFPNRFIKSGKMNGGFMQHIPSNAMPFAFEFTPPKGVEAVKCFALDQDKSKAIYAQTRKAAFDPLSLSNERELTKLYRSLPNVLISEASLIITVQ